MFSFFFAFAFSVSLFILIDTCNHVGWFVGIVEMHNKEEAAFWSPNPESIKKSWSHFCFFTLGMICAPRSSDIFWPEWHFLERENPLVLCCRHVVGGKVTKRSRCNSFHFFLKVTRLESLKCQVKKIPWFMGAESGGSGAWKLDGKHSFPRFEKYEWHVKRLKMVQRIKNPNVLPCFNSLDW